MRYVEGLNNVVMEQTLTSQWVKDYFKVNWFKILIFSLILFIVLKKDFSFEFNLNSPTPPEYQEQETPIQQEGSKKQAKQKSNILSETTLKGQVTPASNKRTSLFDYFRMPFSNKSKAKEEVIERVHLGAISKADVNAYLHRFANVAISERKKFGIPSSLILANALLHSAGGKSVITQKSNNHFELTCTSGWNGDSETYFDHCYRQYESAWSSFRDHSNTLSTGKYTALRKYDAADYHNWAKGLEKLEFSKQKNLASQLIDIIEEYHLHDLDHQ